MKSMIVFSALLALSQATYFNYAPGYAYAAYGPRTALNAVPFTTALNPAYASAFNLPVAKTVVAATDEAAAVALPAATTNAVEVAEEAAVVVDETAANTIRLRPIFPVFDTDLRAGVTEVKFVRPADIVSVAPVDDASKEDFVVITPETRALPTLSALNAPAGIVQASQPRFYSPFRRFF